MKCLKVGETCHVDKKHKGFVNAIAKIERQASKKLLRIPLLCLLLVTRPQIQRHRTVICFMSGKFFYLLKILKYIFIKCDNH